jgi:hypothetical protein
VEIPCTFSIDLIEQLLFIAILLLTLLIGGFRQRHAGTIRQMLHSFDKFHQLFVPSSWKQL